MKFPTRGAWALVLVHAFGSAAIAADRPYPEAVVSQLTQLQNRQLGAQLERLTEDYNSQRSSSDALSKVMKGLGFKAREVEALTTRYAEVSRLPAKFEGGQILIEEGANRIEIGPAELVSGSILVNGKPFSWSRKSSLQVNLTRLESLLKGDESAARFNPLFSEAWADEPSDGRRLFSIQVSGVAIHFLTVNYLDRIQNMRALLTKVNEEVSACENAADQAAYIEHIAANQFTATLAINQIVTDPSRARQLRSCASVRQYAFEASRSPVLDRVPERSLANVRLVDTVCEAIDRLARCARTKLPARAASDKSSSPDLPPAGPTDADWAGSAPAPRQAR